MITTDPDLLDSIDFDVIIIMTMIITVFIFTFAGREDGTKSKIPHAGKRISRFNE